MNAAKPVKANPNAATSLGAGSGGGAAVLYLLGKFGVHVDNYEAGLIWAGAGAAALFIGRNGIRGVIRMFWRGTRSAN